MSATECDVHKKAWATIQWQKKDEQGQPVGEPIPLRVCPERGCRERAPRAGGSSGGGGFRGRPPEERWEMANENALNRAVDAALALNLDLFDEATLLRVLGLAERLVGWIRRPIDSYPVRNRK